MFSEKDKIQDAFLAMWLHFLFLVVTVVVGQPLPSKYTELGLDRYWTFCKCGEVYERLSDLSDSGNESEEKHRLGPVVRG